MEITIKLQRHDLVAVIDAVEDAIKDKEYLLKSKDIDVLCTDEEIEEVNTSVKTWRRIINTLEEQYSASFSVT